MLWEPTVPLFVPPPSPNLGASDVTYGIIVAKFGFFKVVCVVDALESAAVRILCFDTSITAESGQRISNLGLLSDRRNGVTLGVGLSIVGILIISLGRRSR